jgi:hypothetical protein
VWMLGGWGLAVMGAEVQLGLRWMMAAVGVHVAAQRTWCGKGLRGGWHACGTRSSAASVLLDCIGSGSQQMQASVGGQDGRKAGADVGLCGLNWHEPEGPVLRPALLSLLIAGV